MVSEARLVTEGIGVNGHVVPSPPGVGPSPLHEGLNAVLQCRQTVPPDLSCCRNRVMSVFVNIYTLIPLLKLLVMVVVQYI